MHLLHVHRGQLLLRDFQTAFPMALTTVNLPRFVHTTASAPSLRADRPESAFSGPLGSSAADDADTADTPLGDGPDLGIRVVVKVREMLPHELEVLSGPECPVRPDPAAGSLTLVPPPACRPLGSQTFFFDHVITPRLEPAHDRSAQLALFHSIGPEFVDHALAGLDACVFTYGPAGSGKTYAMMGSSADPGLIPRLCSHLFSRTEALTSSTTTYSVRMSYLEIANNSVRDLLHWSPSPSPLKISHHPVAGVYVQGAREVPVQSYGEVSCLLSREHVSSPSHLATPPPARPVPSSHTIFTLHIQQTRHCPASGPVHTTTTVRLVDMAGCCCPPARMAVTPPSKPPSAHPVPGTDHSIRALNRVLSALATPRSARGVVPFRDSVLTLLLRPALVGNAKAAMVVCVSPSDFVHSLSAIQCASSVTKIRFSRTARAGLSLSLGPTARPDHLPDKTDCCLARPAEHELDRPQLEESALGRFNLPGPGVQETADEFKSGDSFTIRALTAQLEALKLSRAHLLDEIDLLRADLKVAVRKLQEGADPRACRTNSGPSHVFTDGSDGSPTRLEHSPPGYRPDSPEAGETENWAAEISVLTDSFLQDLSSFRKKLGDDQARFKRETCAF